TRPSWTAANRASPGRSNRLAPLSHSSNSRRTNRYPAPSLSATRSASRSGGRSQRRLMTTSPLMGDSPSAGHTSPARAPPFLVEDGVVHHRPPLRREDDVHLPVAGLEGERVSEVAGALGEVPLERIGLVAVRRQRHGQRGPPMEAVVVNQQEPAALQFEEI